MKQSILILLLLLSAGCGSIGCYDKVDLDGKNNASTTDIASSDDNVKDTKQVEQTTTNTELDKLNTAIALATKDKDYRLLATSGRSITIPGVDITDVQAVIDRCGIKYHPGVGDVIRSDVDRLKRQQIVTYMRQYNEKMLVICEEKIQE